MEKHPRADQGCQSSSAQPPHTLPSRISNPTNERFLQGHLQEDPPKRDQHFLHLFVACVPPSAVVRYIHHWYVDGSTAGSEHIGLHCPHRFQPGRVPGECTVNPADGHVARPLGLVCACALHGVKVWLLASILSAKQMPGILKSSAAARDLLCERLPPVAEVGAEGPLSIGN